MKNVFSLFTVCLIIGLCACSGNSSTENHSEAENTLPEAELTTSDTHSSMVTADTNEVENQLAENTELEGNNTEPEEKPQPKKGDDRKPAPIDPVKSKDNVPTPMPTSTPVKPVSTPKPSSSTNNITPPPPRSVAPPKPDVAKIEEAPAAPKPQLDHSKWDQLLRKHVSSTGVVDYAGFKGQKSELEVYLKHLEAFSPQADWSKNKKLAYWINIYNAWTVKTIVDSYPVSSITKIDGGKPWDAKRVKSGNKTYTLSEVENDIIRPTFNEPRIHFAVNCAAKSCPPLLNRAWTASNLNANLEKMTKNFINNSQYNQISAKKPKVSKIFEWYAADFGDLINYLNQYSSTKIDKNAKVEFIEYDWNLNGK